MRIKFSPHSLERIKERGIDKKVVTEAIKFPDKIEISGINKNKFLIKKIYYHQKLKRDHLLIIVVEKANTVLKIVTIIDTCKISKYI